MADDTTTQDDEQELGDFLGVDPIYMNYSDERGKPGRSEELKDDDGNVVNEDELQAEKTAYAHQELTREDAGQDPATGEPLDISPAEQLKAQRAVFADPNWSPNVPSPMTAKSEAPAANEANSASSDTGSTSEVKADGTTSDKPAPSAPAAPAAKQTSGK